MRLLFVTPELAPYSRVTPTGDTCAALPKALRGRGHEVTVVSPLYGSIDPGARGLGRRLKKITAELDGKTYPFALYDARTAAGVDLMFLGQEELFAGCDGPPTGAPEEADVRRFAAFTEAVLDLIAKDEQGFDAIQCFDWPTALLPTQLRAAQRSGTDVELPTVLAFGDVDARGQADGATERAHGLSHGLLEAGVRDASRLTTISASYAAAIAEPGAGPLAGTLAERARDLSGITGGIDVAVWNPATDAALETRYDPMDLSGKLRCKAAMQREVGFPVRDDIPLVAVLGPLDASSGLDALARIAARLMRNDVQILVVAEGGYDPDLADVLEEHAERWPDRLSVDAEAERADVHRALSAADLVLVPPKAPAGSAGALRAQRYGALPIAPRVGALADTVVDCDAKLASGSGFLFAPPAGADEDGEVLGALQRAIAAYADTDGFERIRAHVLAADHGWDRAAYLYERLYEQLTRD